MSRSKKYKKAVEILDKTKSYPLKEAVKLLPKLATTKFDSSIEIHINLKLTEKQKKESIRGSVSLPHQVGSAAKIAVITTPAHEQEAKEADLVGGEDLIKKIESGWSDFDILIATPEVMPQVAILGKVLGPKGKMPNPKNKTVTTNLKATIASYKEGKTDFKADKQGGIHKIIGKISLKSDQLLANAEAFLKAVISETQRLQSVPFKSVFLAPTMGPSIRVDIGELMKDLT